MEGTQDHLLVKKSASRLNNRLAEANQEEGLDAPKNNFRQNWAELKSVLRMHWGKITEEDLTQINGEIEILVRILRKRYGYGKTQAEIEIEQWLGDKGDH